MSIRDYFNLFKKRIRKDGRFRSLFIAAVGCFALVIVLVIKLATYEKGETNANDNAAPNAHVSTVETSVVSEDKPYPVPEDAPLEVDKYPEVNTMLESYLDAIANGDTSVVSKLKPAASEEALTKIKIESEYIQQFDNLKIYTKPGPIEGTTFVVFLYYDVVFTDIPKSPAPGMTCLYVVKKPSGFFTT